MDSDLQLIHLLKSAASCAEKELADALHGLGISLCQASLLVQVDHTHLSMSALSKILCCHKSNVTQIVDSLEESGIVERKLNASDRRIAELALTDKGRALMAQAREVMSRKAVTVLSMFSEDEKQAAREMLIRFMEAHHAAQK